MVEGTKALTKLQSDQLLDHFFYYLKPDERARLMGELPKAYNAYVGQKVVKVVHDVDGREY